MKKYKNTLIIVLIALVSFVAGAFLFGGSSSGDQQSGKETAATQWYTCSMHPQIRQDHPGNCPICGMELVPVKQEEKAKPLGMDQVKMSAAAMALANVETWKVKVGHLTKTLYLPGKVKADERYYSEITARFSGRIEDLSINFTGQTVKKGELLAKIYSPELISAQKELLEAYKMRENNPGYFTAAQNKLKLWGITKVQIQSILNSGQPQDVFPIYAPERGTVIKRNVALGDYVKQGTSLFQIANLQHVWIDLDAYEEDLAWLHEGDSVQLRLKAFPGHPLATKIAFIAPTVDEKTHTTQVRLNYTNTQSLLKPGMLVEGAVHNQTQKAASLLIPQSAVLWTGKRAVVYVKDTTQNEPVFTYRDIVLGAKGEGTYAVVSGLQKGEIIAQKGVFQIDAAAQLAGKSSMMNPPTQE